MTIKNIAILLGCAAMAGACTTPEADDDSIPGDESPGEVSGTGGTPTPQALATDGVYQLDTTIEIGDGTALFPPDAADALAAIEALRDAPAATMFELARAAGIDAATTLHGDVAPALAPALDGWIDDHVRGVTTPNGSLAQVVDVIGAIGRADVTAISLDSKLVLGGATGTHRVESVKLDVYRRSLGYDLAALGPFEVEARVPATVISEAGETTVELTPHDVPMPYGKLAWRAANDLVKERFGADLRGVLGAQLDCATLAAAVAARCDDRDCVGHETQLATICEAALDRAAGALQRAVEGAALEPLTFTAGSARAIEGDDGVVSALEDGRWALDLDLGGGRRATTADFSGVRQ